MDKKAENPTPEVLQSMTRVEISNLTLFFDNPHFFKDISQENAWKILEAYHETYWRILKEVFGKEQNEISLPAFPEANIVLTKSKEIFRELYHSPQRFDSLPEWAHDYCNLRRNLYVVLLQENEDQIPIFHISCHEFTHLMIPVVFGLPPTYILQLWPTWMREGFSVGLNQLQPLEWLMHQLHNPEVKVPTLEGIKKNGIFYYDKHSPEKNVAYQYCYWVTVELGKLLRQKIYGDHPKVNVPPLAALGAFSQRSYRKGITSLDEGLQLYGIDEKAAEENCRKLLQLT